ncbi:MAG: response regulator [Phycisphaera sp.]|nr:response regulator [Phycisphaera sp.]
MSSKSTASASNVKGQAKGQAKAQAEILLESGTNELEVLVFSLGSGTYGVNVAKVREVILPTRVTASPDQHPAVLGMFNLRGGVLPLVDLHKYFGVEPSQTDRNKYKIIVTEFNGFRAGFVVEGVEQIYRMSWTNMRPVPESGQSEQFAITGITEINQRLVLMLDFESIIDHINMQDSLHVEKVDNTLGVDRGSSRVFLAEDSNFIRNIMVNVLKASGYTDVSVHNNGYALWNALSAQRDEQGGEDGRPTVIVTDIEMPQMDGLAVTRHVKDDPALRNIPVILFSSLITQDTLHKGKQVGADEQIAKPQLMQLVEIVDRWVSKATQRKAA